MLLLLRSDDKVEKRGCLMKQTWNSFLQAVFRFVKPLPAAAQNGLQRRAAALMTGIAVVTVITFAAGDFYGDGRGAMVAFAETSEQKSAPEAGLEETKEETSADQADMDISKEEEAAAGENRAAKIQIEETGDAGLAEAEAEAAGTGTGTAKAKSETAAGESAAEAENVKAEETKAAPVVACSDSDYQVLLKIVQAEAGGCDTKGRILVANVIINRVQSSQFPNTITGVVYQKSQFSPVSNGSINSCKVTQETVDAVDRALAGEDYSQGALYFMNRRAATGKNASWFDRKLSYLFKHGNHEFFR